MKNKKSLFTKIQTHLFAIGPLFLFELYIKYLNSKERVKSPLLISKKSDIVIEGYGGSANSFAVYAFEFSQPEIVNIAHHVHLKGQIFLGIKWDKPIIVLIRNPKDAIKSLISRGFKTSIFFCLVEYYSFYKYIWKNRNRVIIAPFEQIVTDYSAIIAKLNKKFKTSFRFNTKSIEYSKEKLMVENDDPKKNAFPNIERKKLKSEIEKRINKKKYNFLMRKSEKIYKKIIQYNLVYENTIKDKKK